MIKLLVVEDDKVLSNNIIRNTRCNRRDNTSL